MSEVSSTMGVVIDPDAINRYLADRILESALGERLTEMVDQAIKGMGSYGNDPMKSAVQAEIAKHVQALVRTEHAETIAAAVRERLTDAWITEMVGGFLTSLERAVGRF